MSEQRRPREVQADPTPVPTLSDHLSAVFAAEVAAGEKAVADQIVELQKEIDELRASGSSFAEHFRAAVDRAFFERGKSQGVPSYQHDYSEETTGQKKTRTPRIDELLAGPASREKWPSLADEVIAHVRAIASAPKPRRQTEAVKAAMAVEV